MKQIRTISSVGKIAKRLTLVVAALVIVFYSTLQAKDIVLGPDVTVTTPANGEKIRTNETIIAGNTKNISSITLNDSPIYVDDKGAFSEKILLAPGYSVIEINVKDRFGREKTEFIYLLRNLESEDKT